MARLEDFLQLNIGIGTRQCPSIIGQFQGKRCVVVASAKCVWDDLDRLGVHGGKDNNGWDILCINDVVMHYPGRVAHLYSNKNRLLDAWLAARRETIGGFRVKDWGPVEMTHSCSIGGQHSWPWPGNGTSALGAVYTALALGYDPVVLCGIPLDNSPHYFDPDWIKSNFEREVGGKDAQMKYWGNAMKAFRGRVTSMSGRTKELLG